MTSPTKRGKNLNVVNSFKEKRNSTIAASDIAGIPKRKEYFAASLLFQPIKSELEIVIPDLETPGIIANACAIPIKKLSFLLWLFISTNLFLEISAKYIKKAIIKDIIAIEKFERRVFSKKSGINNFTIAPRNIIGIVPQKTRLINDSLLNNIILESDEKLKNEKRFNNAIKFAQLKKTIKENKDGIQYIVGQDGSSLSGGQSQRIAIARALYENPEILILDEITSALDSKTSQQLFDCINDLIGKKTLIMISHNEDLSKRADKIFRLTKDQNQTKLIKLYEKN